MQMYPSVHYVGLCGAAFKPGTDAEICRWLKIIQAVHSFRFAFMLLLDYFWLRESPANTLLRYELGHAIHEALGIAWLCLHLDLHGVYQPVRHQ